MHVAFPLATFVGAFLLFLVQPLMAKQILPWFGGAPAVWSTCMVFFQVALVAGYAYAHVTRRLGLRRQMLVHGAALIVAMATLPIVVSAAWKPPDADAPTARLLLMLTASVGAPYLLLAATAPLLQDWHAQAAPGPSPYRLYVLSNAGSLVALLSYPLWVEPLFAVRSQAYSWSAGFLVFAGLCGWCGWWTWHAHGEPAAPPHGSSAGRESVFRLGAWILFSACGTGLLLAVTNQLCQDVASVPLLWIVPLALYLLTFIVTFAGWYRRWMWAALYLAALLTTASLSTEGLEASIWVQGGALLALMTAGCMVCHGELVTLRPGTDRLTAFYLAIATGGSLGGIFVTLLAPHLFTTYLELPLLAVFVILLLATAVLRDLARRPGHKGVLVAFSVPAAVFIGGIALAVRPTVATASAQQMQAAARNFYGILRVVDDPPTVARPIRRLFHGQVVHGAQFLNSEDRTRPITYYGAESGMARALGLHGKRIAGQPLDIGVVGLGVGTIAALAEASDTLTFFEINPDAIQFAHQYFTYLADSPAEIRIVPGDARLSLQREVAQASSPQYDLLVIDAFAGDSIPIHLVTREAFDLYFSALASDGTLVLNVTNRYVDLTGVVTALAAERGLEPVWVVTEDDPGRGQYGATWGVVTPDVGLRQRLAGRERALVPTEPTVWTDDFSSLLGVLR